MDVNEMIVNILAMFAGRNNLESPGQTGRTSARSQVVADPHLQTPNAPRACPSLFIIAFALSRSCTSSKIGSFGGPAYALVLVRKNVIETLLAVSRFDLCLGKGSQDGG